MDRKLYWQQKFPTVDGGKIYMVVQWQAVCMDAGNGKFYGLKICWKILTKKYYMGMTENL